MGGVVGSSLIAETSVGPQHALMIVMQTSIQVLILASNVSVDGSGIGARKVLPDSRSTPPKDRCCVVQPGAILLSLAKAAVIYFHKLSSPFPSYCFSVELAIKSSIASRQNCIQSATVWREMMSGKGHRRSPYCEREHRA